MARQNNAYLYGFVDVKPTIHYNQETKEPTMAWAYLHVVRSVRDAHDGKKYMKHDHPLIISLDPPMIARIAEWKENDVVYVKGTITSKRVEKKSFCPNCQDEEGKAVANTGNGLLLYVTPIFTQIMKSFATKDEAITEVIHAREISNQAIVVGNLLNDPKYFKTKRGLVVTQYQLITDRKYRIRMDDPEQRTDWPWVKSYGEQAIEDRLRLTKNSCVIIDGCLQARTVKRKTKCKHCGKIYEWEDKTMEIVPFDTEYVRNTYKTDEMLEAEEGRKAEEIRQQLFDHLVEDELTEDMNTDDLEES